MPRPALPPTPQSSVDLPPKPAPSLSSVELAFKLPPPALASISSSISAPPPKPSYDISSSPSSSPSNCVPLPPLSQLDATKKTPNEANLQQPKKRRRASILETPKPEPSSNQKPTVSTEAITLPPPPTRNRKIIQMKPRQPSTSSSSSSTQQAPAPEPKAKSKKATGSKLDKSAEDGKPTTAVGRKIARKTAHSLIERRRRFKMNEEFGVLKGMIPACVGVEMHKLAILQASIEYLKYLEQCVADLKASNSTATHQNKVPTLPPGGYDNDDDEEDEEDENDEEMADPESAGHMHEQPQEEQAIDNLTSNEEFSTRPMQPEELTPTFSAFHSPSRLTSPYLQSTKSQYSPTQSQCSSAFFTPQPVSATTSPNLYPQQHPSSEHGHDQVDTEATHALLLLADGSRRNSEVACGASPEKKGRGMSVKDLLSP